MNEFVVVFNSGTLDVSCYLQNFMQQYKMYDIWDEDLISNVKRFGTNTCFRSAVVMYKVIYPKQLDKSIVCHYLDCFYFDHLWGDQRCNFKWKDYIVDLLEKNVNMYDIKIAMELGKQVTSIQLKVPKYTDDSHILIENFHKQCLKKHCCDCIQQLAKLKSKV